MKSAPICSLIKLLSCTGFTHCAACLPSNSTQEGHHFKNSYADIPAEKIFPLPADAVPDHVLGTDTPGKISLPASHICSPSKAPFHQHMDTACSPGQPQTDPASPAGLPTPSAPPDSGSDSSSSLPPPIRHQPSAPPEPAPASPPPLTPQPGKPSTAGKSHLSTKYTNPRAPKTSQKMIQVMTKGVFE